MRSKLIDSINISLTPTPSGCTAVFLKSSNSEDGANAQDLTLLQPIKHWRCSPEYRSEETSPADIDNIVNIDAASLFDNMFKLVSSAYALASRLAFFQIDFGWALIVPNHTVGKASRFNLICMKS